MYDDQCRTWVGRGGGSALPVHISNPSLIYSLVLGSKIRNVRVRNVRGAIYYLICGFYAHSTQSPTIFHSLHHIWDITCSSIIIIIIIIIIVDRTRSTHKHNKANVKKEKKIN